MLYAALATHRLLIRDSTRTEAFRRAIESTVRPGDVVLDVGAGSGILSLFAARAGARRVYAVERTAVGALAGLLARRNGFGHVVRVVQAAAEAVRLPEPVDVIVSEWLGTIGVDENLLAVVLGARDRFLKPGGRMVPARVTAWMAPAHLAMRPDADFFHARPYGLDLAPLGEPVLHELLSYRRRVDAENLAAPPRRLWTTDARETPLAEAVLPARAAVEFTLPRPGPVNALAAWFQAELAPGVVLTNAPDAPDTHWGQLTLPLRRELRLAAGEVLAVRFACIPAGRERSELAWSVRAGGGAWEHHDTRALPSPWNGRQAGGAAAAGPGPVRRRQTTPEGQAPMGLALRRFLARLSVDPELLRDFIRDPGEVMDAAGLSESERQALVSRDQSRIQLAVMDGAARPPAGSRPPTPRPGGPGRTPEEP